MSVPRITMTMLGAEGSGKTTFLHGMYARLSAGMHGYFLYTLDPDQDLDLTDAWQELNDKGRLPENTSTDPFTYEFRLAQGLETLLDLSCTDFRGGALTERGSRAASAEDITRLREQVKTSDSLHLVLDGEKLGGWVAAGCPKNVNRATDGMQVARLSRYIRAGFDARRGEGKPPPSVVLLVTKMDLLPRATGMSKAQALCTAVDALENLLPLLYEEGITALVCPVQIGDFGSALAENRRIDQSKIHPQNLHKPIVFSLWHFLTETLTADRRRLAELEENVTSRDSELAELRRRLMNRVLNGEKISSLDAAVTEDRKKIEDLHTGVDNASARAQQLMDEFDGLLQMPSGGAPAGPSRGVS